MNRKLILIVFTFSIIAMRLPASCSEGPSSWKNFVRQLTQCNLSEFERDSRVRDRLIRELKDNARRTAALKKLGFLPDEGKPSNFSKAKQTRCKVRAFLSNGPQTPTSNLDDAWESNNGARKTLKRVPNFSFANSGKAESVGSLFSYQDTYGGRSPIEVRKLTSLLNAAPLGDKELAAVSLAIERREKNKHLSRRDKKSSR